MASKISEMLLTPKQVPFYGGGMKTLFEQLRKAMNESGHTRHQISKVTGLPESTLSRFANGLTEPSLPTMIRLASFLGLELRWMRKGKRNG